MRTQKYCGRFAPSPTGPLHRGSLVAALASYIDARAHRGKWLIRIENTDTTRERPDAVRQQLASLTALGLVSDEAILVQSTRTGAYDAALQQLRRAGRVYYCRCSRGQRAAESAGSLTAYPGTCRDRGLGPPGAVRLRLAPGRTAFCDRALGPAEQDVSQQIGDFVLFRADGCWAYQLAVVVDDAFQGVTDVVRGADLLDNTPRQIQLQRALGLPTPRYLHVPLVLDNNGRKLSKSDAALPLDAADPAAALRALEDAWRHLGFCATHERSVGAFLQQAAASWAQRWPLAPAGPAAAGGDQAPLPPAPQLAGGAAPPVFGERA